ncbi:class I SAM-dependent methyltransferase [Devosia faecipullorum]|uniref:class I SAM-dependent methyltransferase n=1 Tax=Devosia faecipullorum TaxID=2755039 RepID=UPI00187B630D|nr:50S ribosomal protein L11 methyltransferase [Devosia faecipullorum]MBE7732756.1 methyltransferase [Devosia faecipullorum]
MNPEGFILQHMRLEKLAFRPDIALYRPIPQSGLHAFLAEQGHADRPPYWAYAWAGGAALALHLSVQPEIVADRSVLDFGAGSGLVAIAAALAGAARVTACEPDPLGRIAIGLNAKANGLDLNVTDNLVPADLVLAGDVFYDAEIARATLPLLRALAQNGASVLIGDPFRRHLPLHALEQIAEYALPDMGGTAPQRAGIFTLRP